MTEPCALIAIVKGSSQVVLVGDHHQLPPTVQEKAKAAGLNKSLFERLAGSQSGQHSVVMLNQHYRCHPFIIDFPSKEFYGGALHAMVTPADRPVVPGFPWPRPEEPVALIDISGENERSLGSLKKNQAEAEVVAKILRGILTAKAGMHSVSEREIGIVTPYRGQIACIKKVIKCPSVLVCLLFFVSDCASVCLAP